MSSVSATLTSQWSPNQMGYYYAFKLGNFGAAAVVSVLMMLIGIVTAYVVIRVTNFYSTDFSSSD
jgi:multiple sugar transport system permease protein